MHTCEECKFLGKPGCPKKSKATDGWWSVCLPVLELLRAQEELARIKKDLEKEKGAS